MFGFCGRCALGIGAEQRSIRITTTATIQTKLRADWSSCCLCQHSNTGNVLFPSQCQNLVKVVVGILGRWLSKPNQGGCQNLVGVANVYIDLANHWKHARIHNQRAFDPSRTAVKYQCPDDGAAPRFHGIQDRAFGRQERRSTQQHASACHSVLRFSCVL